MELNEIEVTSVVKCAEEASLQSVQELNDLQLAFVGGGVGEICFN